MSQRMAHKLLLAVLLAGGCTADATGKNANGTDHHAIRYSVKEQPDKPSSKPPATIDPREMVKIAGTQQRESDKPGGTPVLPGPEPEQSDDPDPAKPLPILDDGYYTFDECQTQGADGITIWKSRYASCLVENVALQKWFCTEENVDTCVMIGEEWVMFTFLGRGSAGGQRLDYQVRLDHWRPTVGVLDPTMVVTVLLDCTPTPGAMCSSLNALYGRTSTIAEWKADPEMTDNLEVTGVGGGDGQHFDLDQVSYHLFAPWLRIEGATLFNADHYFTGQKFRCDAAPYANGGACLFHEVQSVLHYSLSAPDYGQVSEHIKFAQEHPDQTDPKFDPPGRIPGSVEHGPALLRLYANDQYQQAEFDDGENAQSYYDRNRAVTRAACNALGLTAEQKAGKQCDEYPFASTYMGAHLSEMSVNKFSIRYVDSGHNNRAGQILQRYYADDHVIARDSFYVQIDP